MKREHEAAMFIAAVLDATRMHAYPDYVEAYYANLFEEEDMAVLSPKGSSFKNCACIVTTQGNSTNAMVLLKEYNPDMVLRRLGGVVFVFKEGQHVMEATGAAAALRKQAKG